MASLNFSFILCGFIILYMAKCAQNERIVGGSITTINAHPHQVLLRNRGKPFCGGVLVKSTHVVTAAHCVQGLSRDSLTVNGNTSYLNEPGIVRRVSRIFIPQQYNTPRHNMDVAVLRLASPMTGKYARPINLYPSVVPENAALQVTGWGVTNETFVNPPNQLRKATIKKVNQEICRAQYAPTVITNTMVCASLNGRKDTCQGDSGGPLVYMDQLAGITSFGSGCASPNKPGVYTSIANPRVLSFIQRAMRL